MMTVKPKKKKKRSVKGLEERKEPQTRAYTLSLFLKLMQKLTMFQ